MPPQPALERTEFWSVFDQSRIPMVLVDRARRYINVNNAGVEVFKHPREEILSGSIDWGVQGGAARSDEQWATLIRTNELYGADVITPADGEQMHITYAAHAMTMDDDWVALVVTLSARLDPDGEELIGAPHVASGNGARAMLTNREREVVRLLTLGSTTRQIAADLQLSPDTIRAHVRNSMAKTGAHTRAQLVAMTLAAGSIND
jgi:DNA-binding CsgD family transcriptional regulator